MIPQKLELNIVVQEFFVQEAGNIFRINFLRVLVFTLSQLTY